VEIQQMQIRYDAAADRLLWQLRTARDELYAVWLTRRMVKALWPPFQHLVTQAGIQQVLPHASAANMVPEARDMLAQQARDRPLPSADFSQPFNAEGTTRPLGEQPMLPVGADLGPAAKGRGLMMRLRESSGRSMELQVSPDLATALSRLLEQGVAAADWGLEIAPVRPPAAQPAAPPVLN
jgi:hypothetical protein